MIVCSIHNNVNARLKGFTIRFKSWYLRVVAGHVVFPKFSRHFTKDNLILSNPLRLDRVRHWLAMDG